MTSTSPKRAANSASVAAVLLSLLIPSASFAQWTNVPQAKIPRTPDGMPDLLAPAPTTQDGKPDLSGVWSPTDNRYGRDIAAALTSGDIPYQPWAKALFDERKDGAHSKEDPDANCLPQGVPKINAIAYPQKFIQSRESIVIVYEAFTLWRQIFMDGRGIRADANPTWMGYSTGKWEGDTLVVDTRGFNGKAWLDQQGRPSTDALHVIERFHRKNVGHMEIRITIEDPKAYTRPWTIAEELHLLPETEPMEFICNENTRDLEHLPGRRFQ
jgi:hypothetical protein